MTIAASLMILVSLFSDRWLIGSFDVLPQNVGKFMSEDDNEFPHAWKGAITCFSVGLGIMVMTVALSLFTLGLLAYPAGWGSKEVMKLCHSQPFSPGECRTGAAFWVAVTGTVASYLASCLSIPAHRATQGGKA